MRYAEWEPIYEEILEDFGFFGDQDEEAAALLSELLRETDPGSMALASLDSLIRGRFVLVCGNAPSLSEELAGLVAAGLVLVGEPPANGGMGAGADGSGTSGVGVEGWGKNCVVVSADGATSVLLRQGVVPDVIVTDLDGDVEDILEANRSGSVVVVHAHGDNVAKLREHVPRLRNVLGTCQSEPVEGVHNFGGFTDGDRCVFLAEHFGASKIRMIGFDFEDETVTPRKRKKLAWARRLIALALGG